jgi:hypothetical protein
LLKKYIVLFIIGRGVLKSPIITGQLWLIPVILATQEAEIRKVVVQNLPG